MRRTATSAAPLSRVPRPSARLVARLALLVTALFGLPSSAAAATALYPDLETLPPRSLRFDDAANVNPDPLGPPEIHHVLRFTNTTWNAGQGALAVWSAKVGDLQTNPNVQASQRIVRDDGSVETHPVGVYFFHRQHDHFHFDDWGRYELWTAADWDAWNAQGRPATGFHPLLGQKTTSCMLDEEFIATFPRITPGGPVYSWSGCMPDAGGVIKEGISPGWGDTYDYFRFEQWIDLGARRLADGRYVLRSIADPTNKIYESAGRADPVRESVEDNEGVKAFSVRGGELVDEEPATGTITVNGVATTTTSTVVTVGAVARDDVGSVDRIRLSNDGSHWTERAFDPDPGSPSTPVRYRWDLADAAAGGSGAGGTRIVFAQFRDSSGVWGRSVADTIVLSGTAGPTGTVQVERSGDGRVVSNAPGIDCGAVCSASFPRGNVITLIALPGRGARFAGWSGACAGTTWCEVPAGSGRSVSAAFVETTTPPPIAPGPVAPPVGPPPATTPPVVVAAPTIRRVVRPPTPRGLRAVVVVRRGRRLVRLRWLVPPGSVGRFVIQRSRDGRRWSTLAARVPRRSRVFVDGGATRRGRYRYRIRSVAADGRSGWSNVVVVRIS